VYQPYSIAVLYLILGFSLTARAEFVRQDEVDELNAVATRLTKAHPQSKTVYVFVGRGPAGISMYFHCLGAKGIDLPLTRFSEAVSIDETGSLRSTLKEEQLQRLFTHLDRILPSDEVLGGRELVFVDTGRHGRTLSALMHHIPLYRSQRRRHFVARSALLKIDDKIPILAADVPDTVIPLDPYPLVSLHSFDKQYGYEKDAAIGSWSVYSDEPGPTPNPNLKRHERYLDALNSAIALNSDARKLQTSLGLPAATCPEISALASPLPSPTILRRFWPFGRH